MSARVPLKAPHAVLVYAPRERVRTLARGAFPRRRRRVLVVRDAAELESCMRTTMVDAVLVDAAAVTDDTWRAAGLAREFPSIPFFGVLPLRAGDGGVVARLVQHEFADVLLEGVDDVATAELVEPHCFSARFAEALREPPAALGLEAPVQRDTWRCVVSQGGRGVRTEELSQALGMTREHLSRTFAAGGAPNLKRVIDLVRLIAAAELSKNPGLDVGDVAAVLGFASSSHLSTTAQRVVGTKPASLARLRTVDLVERFVQGRGRSRN